MDSGGIFAGLYKAMAENAALLPIVDFLNVWGLVFIGLGLLLGLFTRVATIGGIVLLLMYYFSHPPIIGLNYALPNEGSYLIVNKTLIEAFALAVLAYFPTGKEVGLDRLLFSVNKNKGMEDKHRGEKFEAA